MPVKEPRDLGGGRGLRMYGGEVIRTTYGHTIAVRDSSAASGPCIWLDVEGGELRTGPHLDLDDVLELRERLDQFLRAIPERWDESGQEKLKQARARVLGEEKAD